MHNSKPVRPHWTVCVILSVSHVEPQWITGASQQCLVYNFSGPSINCMTACCIGCLYCHSWWCNHLSCSLVLHYLIIAVSGYKWDDVMFLCIAMCVLHFSPVLSLLLGRAIWMLGSILTPKSNSALRHCYSEMPKGIYCFIVEQYNWLTYKYILVYIDMHRSYAEAHKTSLHGYLLTNITM